MAVKLQLGNGYSCLGTYSLHLIRTSRRGQKKVWLPRWLEAGASRVGFPSWSLGTSTTPPPEGGGAFLPSPLQGEGPGERVFWLNLMVVKLQLGNGSTSTATTLAMYFAAYDRFCRTPSSIWLGRVRLWRRSG